MAVYTVSFENSLGTVDVDADSLQAAVAKARETNTVREAVMKRLVRDYTEHWQAFNKVNPSDSAHA
jgi:hypothetical protein